MAIILQVFKFIFPEWKMSIFNGNINEIIPQEHN